MKVLAFKSHKGLISFVDAMVQDFSVKDVIEVGSFKNYELLVISYIYMRHVFFMVHHFSLYIIDILHQRLKRQITSQVQKKLF